MEPPAQLFFIILNLAVRIWLSKTVSQGWVGAKINREKSVDL